MKTLLVPQVALAVLAFVPTSFGQDPGGHAGVVEFTRPSAAPRARVAQSDEPPKLGVTVSETDDGVQISEVSDGSLADRAGLVSGDILFKIAGSRVSAITDIPELLSTVGPGETIGITVIRPGQGLVTLHGKRAAPKQAVREREIAARNNRLRKRNEAESRERSWTPSEGGGFLGVELGEGGPHGVTIDGVIMETAAWFAGLDDGDILVSVNGHDLHSGQDVAEAIGSRHAGETVKLVYLRDGEQHKSKVRLGHRKTEINNPQGNVLRGLPEGFDFQFDHDGEHDMHFGEGSVFFGDDVQFFGDDMDWEEFGEKMEDWAEDFEHEMRLSFDGDDLHDLDISELHEHLQGLEGLKHLHKLKGLKGLHGLKALKGLDLDHLMDGHTGQLMIKIEDGVMTIDRDGEVEVIELGDAHDSFIDDIHFLSPNGETHGLQILSNGKFGGLPANIRVLAGPGAAECEALAAECAAIAVECAAEAVERCEAIAAECADLAAECADVVSEVSLVTTTSTSTTVECADAAAECVTVTIECEEVAADCADATECCSETKECDESADSDSIS
jgi:membrane-associated protease RseP (regulator of RpoE activity)